MDKEKASLFLWRKMRKSKSTVYIICGVHNGLDYTKKLLKSIKKQTYPQIQTTIIDDGSTDGTSNYIEKEYKNVTVLKSRGNLWWTGSLHLGVQNVLKSATNGDFILTINNDCEFDKDLVSKLVTTSDRFNRAIVGSLIIDVNDKETISDAGVQIDWSEYRFLSIGPISIKDISNNKKVEENIDTLSTKGTLYPIEVFHKVGNFDKKHLPHYISDYEFACRAKRAGYKLLLSYDAKVFNDIKRTGIGHEAYKHLDFSKLINILFSKRSRLNIIDHFWFIYLCCPPKYKIRNYVILFDKFISLASKLIPLIGLFRLSPLLSSFKRSQQIFLEDKSIQNTKNIAYCTYFDRNYIIKGLTMYYSLKKHNPGVKLWVLCMDKYTQDLLYRLNEKNIEILPLSDFEDEQLLNAKKNRSKIEYYWTCTPSLPLYLFNKNKEYDYCVYIDADMMFYSSYDPLFKEMGNKSIYIVEHRYPKDQQYRNNRSGRFNVGILAFKNNREGLTCLKLWRRQCLDWCFWREEEGKMGDQMYLNAWPKLYRGLVISKNLGVNAAPWNIMQYRVSREFGRVKIDENDLMCYHFHKFRIFPNSYALTDGYNLNSNIIKFIYAPYIKEIRNTLKIIKNIDANFNFFDKRGKNERLKNMPNISKFLESIKKISSWKN